MNKQEVFDKMVKHAAQMTCRSAFGGSCRYYNEDDGNRCLVGIFLSVEDARICNPLGVWSSVLICTDTTSGTTIPAWMTAPEMVTFLDEVQRVHDRCYSCDGQFADSLLSALKDFARSEGLFFNDPRIAKNA